MATFFNQKQDVIDIELTKYGEYLLSIGKFSPKYYSFYDNGVIYDTRYAAISSSQNQNEGRIQSETPSLRTQHSFEGRAEQITKHNAFVDDRPHLREDQKIRIASTTEKNFGALYSPLGNSDLSSEEAPLWDMKFYHNEMLNWEINYTGSQITRKTPQIESSITYKTKIKSTQNKPPRPEGAEAEPVLDEDGIVVPGGIYQPIESEPVLAEGIFDDGTFVEVEADYILLDLLEENAEYKMENFDIEVYEIKTETLANGTTRDELIPMKFKKKSQSIVDGILVDSEQENIELDPSYVEYFFDVFVDSEIDELTMCKAISELKSKGILIETDYVCPDIPSYSATANLYTGEQDLPSNCEVQSPAGSGNSIGVS
jgi:uncharacterized protein YozE (UPF0346 family)